MLWSPSQSFIESTNFHHYVEWLVNTKRKAFNNYHEVWKWSVDNLEDFWKSIWEYFDIIHEGKYNSVLGEQQSYNVSWFEGTRLNYAEHIFRKANALHPAIVIKTETSGIREISWQELHDETASLEHYLRSSGIV